jgi:hypothetical protein
MSAVERQVLVRNAARLGRAAQRAAATGDHRRAADLYRAALLLLHGDPLTTDYRELLDSLPAMPDIPATARQDGLDSFGAGEPEGSSGGPHGALLDKNSRT